MLTRKVSWDYVKLRAPGNKWQQHKYQNIAKKPFDIQLKTTLKDEIAKEIVIERGMQTGSFPRLENEKRQRVGATPYWTWRI